jgi:parallel beta-helix repeat protein
VSAIAVLSMPAAALAAVCEDRAAAPITTVPTPALKCQEKIALEGAKFLRAKMKTLSACKVNKKVAAGGCPTAKDLEKIEKAAATAAANIAKACGDDAAQAGLGSSYASLTDPAPIASCMLSQHNVIGEWIVANANGATNEAWTGTGKERAACVKEINRVAWQTADLALKHAGTCIKTQMKKGTAGDLAPVCVGSFAGGSYVPPTDTKTAGKLTKLFAQSEAKIATKCAPVETLGQLRSLFACPGATSVAELQECVVCNGFDAAVDALEQQYVETGTFVPHGTDAIQTAVDAASAGQKLLIASGTYAEEVVIQTDGLQLVGCGGATGDRPRIVPPSPEVSGRGIRANDVDGLVFQSLETFGQANDGIRISLANGVTFRDIVGDGNLQSAYAIFPVTSNGVLIELCKVTRVDDAPLYVGQSSGIVVRFNEVRDSVAGIEIENCGNAQVYGNYATNNTAGLLVFKDGSLPVQLSQCHEVHHNLFEANNTPNFGTGTVAGIPAGTGMLVISNDTSIFQHNISRNNRTFGLAFVDQQTAEFGPPFSADSIPQDNYILDNVMLGNGSDPDFAFGADVLGLYVGAPAGNCQSGNVFDVEAVFNLTVPQCTVLPPPPYPSCPAPPVP